MQMASLVKRGERRGWFQVPLLQPESRYPGQTFIADLGILLDGALQSHFDCLGNKEFFQAIFGLSLTAPSMAMIIGFAWQFISMMARPYAQEA